jgi:type III secretory pathway component EscR
MAAELIWTIVFGVLATAIGVVTIWQNFQIVKIKVEGTTFTTTPIGMLTHRTVMQRVQYRPWYGYGP